MANGSSVPVCPAARVLTTRSVPELHFELDKGLEHAARINALLGDIHREEPD